MADTADLDLGHIRPRLTPATRPIGDFIKREVNRALREKKRLTSFMRHRHPFGAQQCRSAAAGNNGMGQVQGNRKRRRRRALSCDFRCLDLQWPVQTAGLTRHSLHTDGRPLPWKGHRMRAIAKAHLPGKSAVKW
jgi:hypothetical protein